MMIKICDICDKHIIGGKEAAAIERSGSKQMGSGCTRYDICKACWGKIFKTLQQIAERAEI